MKEMAIEEMNLGTGTGTGGMSQQQQHMTGAAQSPLVQIGGSQRVSFAIHEILGLQNNPYIAGGYCPQGFFPQQVELNSNHETFYPNLEFPDGLRCLCSFR